MNTAAAEPVPDPAVFEPAQEGALKISLFDNEHGTVPEPVTWDWLKLVDELNTFREAECCLAPGPNQCGTGRFRFDDKGNCTSKFGKAWSPASYLPGSTRSKRNVESVSLLVLDCDHLSDSALDTILARLAAYQYILHSSHSHGRRDPNGDSDNCVRVVLALSRPVPGAEWTDFWRKAVHHLKITEWVDKAPKDPSRLYFLPCTPKDGDPLFDNHPGQVLDVEAVQLPDEKSNLTSASVSNTPDTPPRPIRPLSDYVRDRILRATLKRTPAISGATESRDSATFATAGFLVKECCLTKAEAMPILRQWNELCRPPASESVLQTKLDNALAYASGNAGEARRRYEDDEAQEAASEEIRELFRLGITNDNISPANQNQQPDWLALAKKKLAIVRGTTTADNKPDLYGQHARDFAKEPPTPIQWKVRNLVTEGGVGAIVGDTKSSKTWLASDIAIGLSSGTEVLSTYQVPKACKVFYFYAEDWKEAVLMKLRALACGRGSEFDRLNENLYLEAQGKDLDLLNDDHYHRLIASCLALPGGFEGGVLILDPLRNIHTGSENESDSMSEVMHRLRYVSLVLKCTVLIVHHNKKPSQAGAARGPRGTEFRGSSAISGALYFWIAVKDLDICESELQTTFESTLEVVTRAGRGAGKPRVLLTLEDDPATDQAHTATWQVLPEGKPGQKEKIARRIREEIIQAVRAAGDKGITTEDLISKVTGKKDTIKAQITQLQVDGDVQRNEKRRWIIMRGTAEQTDTPPYDPGNDP